MSLGFVLTYPWSLYDPATRRILAESGTASLDPASCLMLAVPADIDLTVRRGAARLEPEGTAFRWGDERLRLFSLPAPLKPGDSEVALGRQDGRQRPTVLRHEGGERDTSQAMDAQDTLRHERAEAFVEQMVGLVTLLEETAQRSDLGPGRLRWSEVVACWLGDERSVTTDPRMALIVRHAERLATFLVRLVERPRRVLERVRALTPVVRASELDRACIGWYVRQPGTTVAQKAGPRQRLLAVARRESHDTLENQVLRDLLRRSVASARRYLLANAVFKARPRHRSVERYRAICRRLATEPTLAEVRPLAGLPTPNYTLQFDERYRQVWQAWLELLHEEQAADEAWRWQRRLWADIVRAALIAALTQPEVTDGGRARGLALSPLEVRGELARGRFGEPRPFMAAILLKLPGHTVVIEAHDPGAETEHENPLLPPGLAGLGAALVLRVTGLGSNQVGYVPVWALHLPGDTPDLAVLLASATKALSRFTGQLELQLDARPQLYGLLVVSAPITGKFVVEKQAGALALGLNGQGFADGIYLLRAMLAEAIGKGQLG